MTDGILFNVPIYNYLSIFVFELCYLINWLSIFWLFFLLNTNNISHFLQDHNTDFIVKFPDWDPSLNFGSDKSQQDNMHILLSSPGTRRFLFQDKSSDFPEAHLWYSTQEVVQALWLFLDAGNDLRGSLTYRYM